MLDLSSNICCIDFNQIEAVGVPWCRIGCHGCDTWFHLYLIDKKHLTGWVDLGERTQEKIV